MAKVVARKETVADLTKKIYKDETQIT